MVEAPDVTGSVPDVVGLALDLSDAMSASAGFTMNSLVFPVKAPPKKETAPNPASARSAKPTGQKNSSAASPAPTTVYPQLSPEGKPFMEVQEIQDKLASVGPTRIRIGLRTVAVDGLFVCSPVLQYLNGFDTKLGDQIAIEMVPLARDDGSVILSTFGFVDPAGSGFGRFWASVLVQAQGSTITTEPIGDMKVTASTPRIHGYKLDTGHRLVIDDY